eukprot:1161697-Pelagomonas_calceolata.AAC.4
MHLLVSCVFTHSWVLVAGALEVDELNLHGQQEKVFNMYKSICFNRWGPSFDRYDKTLYLENDCEYARQTSTQQEDAPEAFGMCCYALSSIYWQVHTTQIPAATMPPTGQPSAGSSPGRRINEDGVKRMSITFLLACQQVLFSTRKETMKNR